MDDIAQVEMNIHGYEIHTDANLVFSATKGKQVIYGDPETGAYKFI